MTDSPDSLRVVPHQPLVPPRARRATWTPAKQRIFLAALLEGGSVAGAARAAGMSRSSAHRLRTRLAGTPFVRIWDRVLAAHAQALADPFAAPGIPPAPAPVAPQARS
ncbi:LysR family transcriptional regulator [Sphingomonas sp. R86521]|uniref:LysR family transcriptional regulator n=1 Tax=Sphingomonas sp. R86521 TaxID=3093860 RepID=UPI0036D30AA0